MSEKKRWTVSVHVDASSKEEVAESIAACFGVGDAGHSLQWELVTIRAAEPEEHRCRVCLWATPVSDDKMSCCAPIPWWLDSQIETSYGRVREFDGRECECFKARTKP